MPATKRSGHCCPRCLPSSARCPSLRSARLLPAQAALINCRQQLDSCCSTATQHAIDLLGPLGPLGQLVPLTLVPRTDHVALLLYCKRTLPSAAPTCLGRRASATPMCNPKLSLSRCRTPDDDHRRRDGARPAHLHSRPQNFLMPEAPQLVQHLSSAARRRAQHHDIRPE
jgi:hypothetical protein